MRFILPASELASAASVARRAVDVRAYTPVLRGLLIEAGADGAVSVTGTDLSERATVSVSCSVLEPGAVVVDSARDFLETVKGFGADTVTLHVFDGFLRIEHATGSCSIPTLPIADWPATPDVGDVRASFELARADWRRLTSSVFRFASKDATRPTLTAVWFGIEPASVVRAVAMDSYRLGFDYADAIEATGSLDAASGLVPARALAMIGKTAAGADSVRASFGLEWVRIEAGAVSILSHLIVGQYPDWRRFMPDAGAFVGSVTFEAAPAVSAAERFAKTAAGKTAPMRLELQSAPSFDRPSFALATVDATTGSVASSATVPVQRASVPEAVTIGCNARFLQDAIEAIGSDSVTVDYINPLRPLIFRNGRADAGVLQMPIRLADA